MCALVCMHVLQARHCGLPENTPLVEQVEVDTVAGAPRTAMQIAADKYLNRAPPAARQPAAYPEPKKRDQFLEFPVMPRAPRLHSSRLHAATPRMLFLHCRHAPLPAL